MLNIPFIVTTDASSFAIGAILFQGPIGKDLPIVFASRTLCPAESGAVQNENYFIKYNLGYKTFPTLSTFW